MKIGDRTSEFVKTSEETDFTAVTKLDGPETRQPLRLYADLSMASRAAENMRFRTFPKQGQPAAFSIAFGGGAGYVPKWEPMWDTIRAQPARHAHVGRQRLHRPTRTHPLPALLLLPSAVAPEWRRLTASTAIYSIYDDHDFGTNDCMPGPDIESPPWKRNVWNVFRNNWVNPAYGGGNRPARLLVRFPDRRRPFHPARRPLLPRPQGRLDARADADEMAQADPQQFEGHLQGSRLPRPLDRRHQGRQQGPLGRLPEGARGDLLVIGKEKIEGVFLIAADRHRTDLRTTGKPSATTLRIRKLPPHQPPHPRRGKDPRPDLGLQQDLLLRPDPFRHCG